MRPLELLAAFFCVDDLAAMRREARAKRPGSFSSRSYQSAQSKRAIAEQKAWSSTWCLGLGVFFYYLTTLVFVHAWERGFYPYPKTVAFCVAEWATMMLILLARLVEHGVCRAPPL